MAKAYRHLEEQGHVETRGRNGTFVRIRGEQELVHGDYLFLGKQLLRVEMTA